MLYSCVEDTYTVVDMEVRPYFRYVKFNLRLNIFLSTFFIAYIVVIMLYLIWYKYMTKIILFKKSKNIFYL